MCPTAVSGKQARYRNIFCPQKEEDLTTQIIQVYFRLVYCHINACNLLKKWQNLPPPPRTTNTYQKLYCFT